MTSSKETLFFKETVSSKQDRSGAHGVCDSVHGACTGSSQRGSKHWEGWAQTPTPDQEVICKGKMNFLSWSLVESRLMESCGVVSTVLQGRPHAQVWLADTELTQWWFYTQFITHIFVWACFS